MKTESETRMVLRGRRSRFAGWVWRGMAAVFAFPPLACVPHRDGATVEPQPELRAKPLGECAQQLWEAERQEDCATVFRFQDLPEDASQDEFCRWYRNDRPFQIHSFRLGEALTEGDVGWVEADFRSSVRKYATVPPVAAHQWQKWRRVGSRWCVVPQKKQDRYPASPALRNADEEARLAAYFRESWDARMERDWFHLYEMTDPQDRNSVSAEEFAESHDGVEYVGYELRWVEVVRGRDRGTVQIVARHKLTDPSLTKLAPAATLTREVWVKRDDIWYLDLKSP